MMFLGLGIFLISACMLDGSIMVGGIGCIVGLLLAVPGIVKENRNAQS